MADTMTDEAKRKRRPTAGGGAAASGLGGAAAAAARRDVLSTPPRTRAAGKPQGAAVRASPTDAPPPQARPRRSEFQFRFLLLLKI